MDGNVHVTCVDRQLGGHGAINLKLDFLSWHLRVGLFGELEELVEAILSQFFHSRQSLFDLALHVQDLVPNQFKEAVLVRVATVATY